jgi:hypothetical protein
VKFNDCKEVRVRRAAAGWHVAQLVRKNGQGSPEKLQSSKEYNHMLELLRLNGFTRVRYEYIHGDHWHVISKEVKPVGLLHTTLMERNYRPAEEKKSLVDLAIEKVKATKQWPNGSSEVIWKSGKRQAYLKNHGNQIALHMNLGDGKNTKGMVVGFLDPYEGRWKISAAVESAYIEWQKHVKDLLK